MILNKKNECSYQLKSLISLKKLIDKYIKLCSNFIDHIYINFLITFNLNKLCNFSKNNPIVNSNACSMMNDLISYKFVSFQNFLRIVVA